MGPIDATTKHVQTWIPLDLNQYGGASMDGLKVPPTYFSCVRSSIMTIVEIMAHFGTFAPKNDIELLFLLPPKIRITPRQKVFLKYGQL